MKNLCFLIIFVIFLISTTTIQAQSLNKYDFNSKNKKQFELTDELKEISGLTVTDDGRLFAHNDEKGIVFQLDINNGKEIKRFYIGRNTLKRDFEGIEAVNGKIYLVTSKGNILEIDEKRNEEFSTFLKYSTGLNKSYDVEGLCYDPENNYLLIACKKYPLSDKLRVVFAFDLKEKKLIKDPILFIPLDKLKSDYGIEKFSSSGIEYNTLTKTFFILSSKEQVILEVSRFGDFLDVVKLNEKTHVQPEGITFLLNQTLIISDEGKEGKGKITIYPLK